MKKFTAILTLILFSVGVLFGQTKTGTLKVFSELNGISVYLDDNRQEDNIQTIKDIPIGSHYLKVLSGNVILYSEVVDIKDGVITTVLIKNKGQVPDKSTNDKDITLSTIPIQNAPIVKELTIKAKTGTLIIFSELTGIDIYLDENKQGVDIKKINDIPIGNHFLKVLLGNVIVYSEVVEIKEDAITTVLIKNKGQVIDKTSEKKDSVISTIPIQNAEPIKELAIKAKTGSLKIFSELTGIVVYLDENKQGVDIQQIKDIPVGNHYFKVLLNNVNIYGEVLEIKDGVVTTILIKNTGQVQEKILDSKTAEREEYNNKKLDIILSKGMTTTTKGYSDLYPGYYGYWGLSNSVATSVETTDWKIIQGGITLIDERTFASLTANANLETSIAKKWKSYNKTIGISAIIAVPTLILSTWGLADTKSFPFFKQNSEEQATFMAINIGLATICTWICLKLREPHGHNISIENAAKDAQKYNFDLKEKLGLPKNYDTK